MLVYHLAEFGCSNQFTNMKTVVQRCSVKKVSVEISQTSQENTLAQLFSCEFFKIFKNTFLTEHLWTTASVSSLHPTPSTYPTFPNQLFVIHSFQKFGKLNFTHSSIFHFLEHVFTYVMRYAIRYHLYNLKNVRKTHGGVSLLVN